MKDTHWKTFEIWTNLAVFFSALPEKGLVEKGKHAKGDKKSKQRLTVAFFVNAAGEKVDQPILIWKSKLSRCVKKLQDPPRPANVHYFRILNLG